MCCRLVKWELEVQPAELSEIVNVLQCVCAQFQDSEQYKCDRRYLRLWVRYVSIFLVLLAITLQVSQHSSSS